MHCNKKDLDAYDSAIKRWKLCGEIVKNQSIAPKNRIILDKKLRFLSEKGLIIHFSIALICVYAEFGIAPP